MFNVFKKSFITGLFLLLPLGVTAFVVNLLLQYIGEPASRVIFGWIDIGVRGQSAISGVLNLISMLVVLLLITGIGLISNYFFGKWIFSFAERLISRVPGINSIYSTIKQVVNTFGENRNTIFSKTVLIEYPRKGSYALGFVTSETQGETQDKTGEFVVNVFIPTTPNPTSGFLLLIPKKDLIELNMSITDGMKLVISGGVVVPPYNSNK